MDPTQFNASVGDFYLSLREFVPTSIQGNLELMASTAGDDLEEATNDAQDAAVRTGTYFRDQCGDELNIN